MDFAGWNLMSFDPVTEQATYSKWEDGRYMVATSRPVGGTLRFTKEARSVGRTDWQGDFHHVANIPANMFFNSDLHRASAEDDEGYIRRWLNDSENAGWRSKEGTI